ncbi:hypothetical protein NQ314_014770 [Rhamnusium bicolor]|uniref:CWH43-like N-terminal domain-containing protein n=1 Tax=Rhamnusium bicolor TaxID=1586634 RepID=A0AAV8X0S7_9CUCU|nr:hypothetical protein NQ314_014770 [Rhamnusium bicolor]
MVFKHSYVVPIILVIWFPLTFIITYTLSVVNENVKPLFPYISDTGSWSPESCIFGILLTTGAIFMWIIIYVRYRQVRELCEKNDFKSYTHKLNKISLYLACIASYGLIVVANFQVTNVLVVHLIGAGMCFGLGTLYQILQVVISFLIYPTFGKKSINIFRAFCTVICIITLTLTSGFALVSILQFTGDDLTKWGKEDGGYDFHLVSTIAEWILAIFTQFFLVTYTEEFKLVEFSEPTIIAKLA